MQGDDGRLLGKFHQSHNNKELLIGETQATFENVKYDLTWFGSQAFAFKYGETGRWWYVNYTPPQPMLTNIIDRYYVKEGNGYHVIRTSGEPAFKLEMIGVSAPPSSTPQPQQSDAPMTRGSSMFDCMPGFGWRPTWQPPSSTSTSSNSGPWKSPPWVVYDPCGRPTYYGNY